MNRTLMAFYSDSQETFRSYIKSLSKNSPLHLGEGQGEGPQPNSPKGSGVIPSDRTMDGIFARDKVKVFQFKIP